MAYAEDDMTSDERTARAVGLPSRWSWSWSLISGGPSRSRLSRYDRDSGPARPRHTKPGRRHPGKSTRRSASPVLTPEGSLIVNPPSKPLPRTAP